jgi:predicted phage tail protein
VSGLVNGTAYRVAVRAVTAVGDGAEARSGLVTPVAPVAPSAPQSLTAKPGDRRVALSWSAPAAAGTSAVTQYAVKVYDGQGATVATYTQAASTRTRTVTGLVNGRSYRFGVRAVSAAGAGTEARTGLVRPVARPGAPRIGTAATGVTGGTVTAKAVWAAPLTNGGSAITGYRVTAYRISSTGAVASQTTSSLRPASARSFSMTLRRGRYRFAVRAVNAIGTSAFSARSNLVTAR